MIDKAIQLKSESETFKIYPIGDVHIGAFNCAENHFRKYVDYIKNQKNAYWFGGGDMCNCIVPSDTKRFDIRALPDWLFVGDAMTVKEALTDIVAQERSRFCEMVEPIKDKCLGLIEGNHEYDIMKHCHNGHHYVMCNELGAPNLTDCVFFRFTARIIIGDAKKSSVITMFAIHGQGGGRTPGAEPNHLARLAQWADADIILRGHSHSFRIEPSTPRLYIPRKGVLGDECLQRDVHTANWGCWLKSYTKGPSTYDSRANYPPRPLKAMEITVKPFHKVNHTCAGRRYTRTESAIEIREICL